MASSANETGSTAVAGAIAGTDGAGLTIAMVAGESSGDLLASRLLSGLQPRLPAARLHGIGGERMAQYGFTSDYAMEKLSVNGLFEVARHYREIKGIQIALRDQLLMTRPSLFIGVDAPDFNLGLEAELKLSGIPTMHFISPSIWAWRGGRIKKIARAASHMLVIFPFEEKLYREAGIPVTYVGHPLAEVIPMVPDVAAARAQLGLPPEVPVIAILPGSRMSELKYNSVAFVEAARLILQTHRDARIVVPMAGARQRLYFEQLLAAANLGDVPLQVLDGQSHTALAAADGVLVASGTASLEVALFKKPMVIGYKMMPATWHILRHMSYQPWIGLPNILAREFLVPELLQNAATPQALAYGLLQQLDDPRHCAALQQRFVEIHGSLLRDTARESAEAVCRVLGKTTFQKKS